MDSKTKSGSTMKRDPERVGVPKKKQKSPHRNALLKQQRTSKRRAKNEIRSSEKNGNNKEPSESRQDDTLLQTFARKHLEERVNEMGFQIRRRPKLGGK
ncbi:expressed unknown protein [Seminavis robusta]|uniref:Uncharacterized protein n=1 Tax=Seminavis robusta TaxID=568900 RepID=A0A9N8DHH3_9STRA|nr:expressed unknown protein [Seminavis robusta]|eukprot:Sro68_g038210.1 n/a (99) ;mRNA; f:87910-88206